MRTIVLFATYILITILIIPVLLFCFLIKWPQPISPIVKLAIKLGQKMLRIRIEVTGLEKVEKKTAYVFMSNHMSFIDGPLLFMLIPQSIRVILKKESFRIPVIGQAMRQVGFIPVDRKGIKGGKKSIDQASRVIKEKGFSFLIFPEGTRSRDGKIQPFKRGGFFISADSQAPVVPISIQGTYELMPKGSFFVKKGKIRVFFHPIISAYGYDRNNLPKLMNKVKSAIESELTN